LIQEKQIAFVSGSTKGIGLAIAIKLQADGYVVIQNSREDIGAKEIQGNDHLVGDVTKIEDCVDLINEIKVKHGRLDVLVCNVGSGRALGGESDVGEYWDHYKRLNLDSATFLIETSLNLLMKSRGNVVAISSICADDPRINAPVGYASSKAALQMYMKSMAVKHGRDGLRFNVVSPGNVYFKGSVWDKKLQEDRLGTEKYINDVVPLRAFISAADIADAVSFLVSEKAKNITGSILRVDGGQSI
jgi:3-oxoacyl-[acyl-carrier protein] reductase